MSLNSTRIDRPRDNQPFEDWCVPIFRAYLRSPALARYGRNGQRQDGLDLIGNNDQGKLVGVQCRNVQSLTATGCDQVVSDVQQGHPGIHTLVIVTTISRDTELQKHVLGIDSRHFAQSLFRVEIWFWDDIEEFLNANVEIRQEVTGGVSGRDAIVIERKLDALAELIRTAPALSPSGESQDTKLDETISSAFDFVLEGRVNEAIGALELLRKNEWGQLSDRLKYRLLANMGTAFQADVQLERAADLWLEARTYSDTTKARLLQAQALRIKGRDSEAREVVLELLKEEPDSDQALGLRIQLDVRSYDEVAAEIPPQFASRSHTAMSLFYRAFSIGRVRDAEMHARAAVQSDPTWDTAHLNLSAVLIHQAKDKGLLAEASRLIIVDKKRVDEALEILNRLLAKTSLIIPSIRAQALSNRAAVNRMLDNEIGATEDVEAAARIGTDSQFVRQLALQEMKDGNRVKALRIVRAAITRDKSDVDSTCLLAFMLMTSENKDEVLEGIALGRDLGSQADQLNDDNRFEMAKCICQATFNTNRDSSSSHELPLGTTFTGLTDRQMQILSADWCMLLGDIDKSRSHMDVAAQLPTEDLSQTEALILARVANRLGSPSLAIRLMRKWVTPGYLSDSLYVLLNALIAEQRHDLLLQEYTEHRLAGLADARFLRSEARLRAQYEDFSTAIQVVRQRLNAEPSDLDSWIMLGNLGVDADDDEAVADAKAHLPPPDKIADDLLPDVVRLLVHDAGVSVNEKLVKVHKIWRHHRTSRDLWKTIIRLCFDPGNKAEPGGPAPDTVNDGFAAIVQLTHSTEQVVICLESHAPVAAWNEHGPTSPIGQAVVNRAVGDAVSIPGSMLSKTGHIHAIMPNWQAALQYFLKHWETQFPDDSWIQRFELPKIEKTSTPEQMKEWLAPLVQSAAERRTSVEKTFDAYRNREISTWAVAEILGLSQWEMVGALLDHENVPFLGHNGAATGLTASNPESNGVVLDVSALVTLSRLGLIPHVCETYRVVIPSLILTVLDAFIAERGNPSQPALTLHEHDGGPRFHEQSPESAAKTYEPFKALLVDLQRRAQTTDALTLAQVSPQLRERMLDIIGPLDARCVALAGRLGLPLIAGDGWVASAATFAGAACASIPSLLDALKSRGVIDESEWERHRAFLAGWDVQPLMIGGPTLVRALELADWDVGAFPASRTLRVLNISQTPADNILRAFLQFVAQFWRRTPEHIDPISILIHVLNILDERRDGRMIARDALRALPGLFGLDVLAAEKATGTIQRWLDSPRPGPSGLYLPR